MWIAGSPEVPTVRASMAVNMSVAGICAAGCNPRAVYLEAPCTASITVPEVLFAMRMIQDS